MKKYTLHEFLADGWYPVESKSTLDMAWSQKEAALRFPKRHKGYAFELKACPGAQYNVTLSYNDRVLHECVSALGPFILNVPRGITTGGFAVSGLWTKKEVLGIDDDRLLGICIQNVTSPKKLLKTCDWFPVTIEMSLTKRCNINPPCVMCVTRNTQNIDAIPDCSEHNIRKMIPYFNEAKFVSLHGAVGEPLLYPKLIEVINLIDTELVYVRFSSNGLLLSEKKSAGLISSGLKEINISIDAACRETYRKFRNNDGFGTVHNNINNLQRLKKEMNSPFPVVIINTVLMKENMNEFPRFIELASELEVPIVHARLQVPLTPNYQAKTDHIHFDYYEQRVQTESDEFKNVIREAKSVADRNNIKIFSDNPEITALLTENVKNSSTEINVYDLAIRFHGHKTDLTAAGFIQETMCMHPWQNFLVDIDGSVRFCCHSLESIGNLNDADFPGIWNGKKARNIRKHLLKYRLPDNCRACPLHSHQKELWDRVEQRP